MLGAIALTETTLKLWKNVFKYFADDRQHIYWSVIAFGCACIFLENWSNRCQPQTIWEFWIFQRIVKIFCCKKVLIIFQKFYWKISFLYCLWAIKDIYLFCNICKCNRTEYKPLPIFMNSSKSKYTWMIPPFHICFQGRMVYIIWQLVRVLWFR